MASQTQPLTPAQAHQLAQEFHDLAAAIGNYRLTNVGTLTNDEQFRLQNLQLQCIQYSTAFITAGLFAQQTDLATTLQTIATQTSAAKQAISTINNVDKILQIATAAAILGASIVSMNPSAVATGVQGLITAIASAPTDNTTQASAGTSVNDSAKPAATRSSARTKRSLR